MGLFRSIDCFHGFPSASSGAEPWMYIRESYIQNSFFSSIFFFVKIHTQTQSGKVFFLKLSVCLQMSSSYLCMETTVNSETKDCNTLKKSSNQTRPDTSGRDISPVPMRILTYLLNPCLCSNPSWVLCGVCKFSSLFEGFLLQSKNILYKLILVCRW